MKISYTWLQELLDFPLPPVDVLVSKIGSQLGAVEGVENLSAKYRAIIVVKIVSCAPLEGSDHLNVCLIDDGGVTQNVDRKETGLVQVVCGAPNVREGLIVAWLPPGSTVPSTFDKEPFVLGARNLRGVMSNGMLASPQELALGDSHDGILEIDTACQPGDSFAAVYKLEDYIIDIENKMFTHRPDCFGLLGVAREVAGILGTPFKEPDWYSTVPVFKSSSDSLPLAVQNMAPNLVPRLMAATLTNVSVRPSSVQVQSYLNRVGIRPINNVVDVTNYCMYLTGQPLHAYDYQKVRAIDGGDTATLTARIAHEGETLGLLNGKEITPRSGSIVMATAERAIGLAGVMGGADTEVDDGTKSIIVECATFDMYSIRRTSMVHGLFSEAVTRFNKGQSPLQNNRVLQLAINMLADASGAETIGRMYDEVAPGITVDVAFPGSVTTTLDFINDRLGSQLSSDDVSHILQNVGFKVEVRNEAGVDELHIHVPFWRMDVAMAEDIVEEVGRLHGFDNLPALLPARRISPPAPNNNLNFKNLLRSNLSKLGASEVLTYSFTNGKLLKAAGQDQSLAYSLTNALSPELQFYRLSVTPSLLEKIQPNIRAGYGSFALFEIGKSHVLSESPISSEDVPAEYERLAFVFASDAKSSKRYGSAPYYQAKSYLTQLLTAVHLSGAVRYVPITGEELDVVHRERVAPFAAGRSAHIMVGDECIGDVGEYQAIVRRNLKLPDYCSGWELDLTKLQAALTQGTTTYKPLPKYPKSEQDICLRLEESVSYQQVFDVADQELRALSEQFVWQLTPVDIFQKPDDTSYKQITLRVTVSHYQKTMTDDEVSHILNDIENAARNELQAERV